MEKCRVVLVKPRIAANIGAVARVMRNFGAAQLFLVAPEADVQDARGRLLAKHAEELLDKAAIVQELGQAVADCVLVVGTSARTGGLFRRQSAGPPEQIMPHLVETMTSAPVALVFGPEPSGLTDAEVTRCHFLIHLPTDPQYPALNLAQAVAITLYELRKTLLRQTPAESRVRRAPFAMQEQMFTRLREALKAIHFLYGDKADALMHAIRHMLGRASLTDMEVKLLLGLARQMKWIADKYVGNKKGSGLESP